MIRPSPANGRVGRSARPLDRRAFTLIELLTVIAIIGILASIVIGMGRHASQSGNIARTKAELAALSTALEAYKRQYGDYPRTNDAATMLQSLVGKLDPNNTKNTVQGRVLLDLALFTTKDSLDPTLNSAAELIDPWENAYAYYYFSTSGQRGYVLYSAGPDGVAIAPTSLTIQNRDSADNIDNIYASF